MEQYEVRGFYFNYNEKNEFEGIFEIDAKGEINGKLKDTSISPDSSIKGNISLGKIFGIEFEKMPFYALANTYFVFKKSDQIRGIEGQYKGFWSYGKKISGNFDVRAEMTLIKLIE